MESIGRQISHIDIAIAPITTFNIDTTGAITAITAISDILTLFADTILRPILAVFQLSKHCAIKDLISLLS